MKVAIVASLLKPISQESIGGTEIFAHLLTEGLIGRGIDVTLFATSDSETRAKLASICSSKQTNGVYEGDLETRIPYQVLQASKVIQRSSEFDIIHNNYYHFYLLSGLSAFTECPIVTTIHNHYWYLPNLKSVLEQTQRKGLDMVVFASNASKKLASGLFDSEVIHHGIDLTPYRFSAKPENYVLWFSRLVPTKGIKDAVEAAEMGNFHLVIAGGKPVRPGHRSYFEDEIKPKLSGDTRLIVSPDEQNKVSLYKNAKALLFPTGLEEQFGLILIEAMACGTPVIAYNRGAIPEVVKDGITGFIIDPDENERPGKGSWIIKKQGIEGLIEAVKRIGEVDRANCRKHVEAHFTKEKMIAEYIALYKRLFERR